MITKTNDDIIISKSDLIDMIIQSKELMFFASNEIKQNPKADKITLQNTINKMQGQLDLLDRILNTIAYSKG